MIIVLNGYPGVGKSTVGRALAATLGGRLLDIHSIYNVAFALTEFGSPEFVDTVERVEAIAHGLIRKLPLGTPVVLTTVLAGDSELGRAEWSRIVALGRDRPPLLVVHIACDLDENMRRIQSPQRDDKRKPRDPQMARRNQLSGKPLAGADAAHLLKLDTTAMSADQAAGAIARWISTLATDRDL